MCSDIMSVSLIRMGLHLELNDIDKMSSFSSLSDIKTGYTPTRDLPVENFKDFSSYESLDTPTPMKSSDFMAYQFQQDPFALFPVTSTGVACPANTSDVQMTKPEPGDYELGLSQSNQHYHSAEQMHLDYTLTENHRQHNIMINPEDRFSLQMELKEIGPYQMSSSLPSMDYHVLQDVVSENPAPVYAPLQTVKIRVNDSGASFNELSSTQDLEYDTLMSQRSESLPNSLSCYNTMPRQLPISVETITIKQEHNKYSSSGPSSTNSYPLRRSVPFTNKEKQFVCNMDSCEKRFARIDELKRHKRTHSDFRPYTCTACDKGFTRSDHLITHKRTHTGEKPYACPHCERCFARSDERSRHVKTHTNPKSNSLRGRRQNLKFELKNTLKKQILDSSPQYSTFGRNEPNYDSYSMY